MKLFGIFVIMALVAYASANCGCLKCCKHCKIVSPACSPLKVIYRGNIDVSGCEKPLPYSVQAPLIPVAAPVCSNREYNYKIEAFPLYKPQPIEECTKEYGIQVQAPIYPIPAAPVLLKNLNAQADRLVLPAPQTYCNNLDDLPASTIQLLRTCPQLAYKRLPARTCALAPGPIIERYQPQEEQTYCDYRYEDNHQFHESQYFEPLSTRSRRKRDLPILSHGINFFMHLLPGFLKLPIQHTLNTMKYKQNKAQNTMNKNLKNYRKQISKQNNDLLTNTNKRYSKLNSNKYNVDNKLLDKETRNFLESLRNPKNAGILTRSKDPQFQSKLLSLFPQLNKPLDSETKKFIDNLSNVENSKEKSNLFIRLADTLTEIQKISSGKPDVKQFEIHKHFIKKPLSEKSKAVLLEKLKVINEEPNYGKRHKRSIILGSDELSVPFFEVKSLSDENDDSEQEDVDEDDYEEEEEIVRNPRYRKYSRPRYRETVTQNPLVYFLNTPLRLLKNFHNINKNVSPFLTGVPNVLSTSKQYLRHLGKNFKNGVLDIASNLIGNFDQLNPSSRVWDNMLKPKRYRRSIKNKYEPQYSSVFNQTNTTKIQNDNNKRTKRYILKVVDEDEVQQFLREKLGSLIEGSGEKPVKKKTSRHKPSELVGSEQDHPGKKKIVVEKLKPKIIIDNNGVPFMDINGVKRPIFLKRKTKKQNDSREDTEEVEIDETVNEDKKTYRKERRNEDSSEEIQIHEKISDLIEHAKERIENGEHQNNQRQGEVPIQTIKEKMTHILIEIDILNHMDFDEYSSIYDELLHLENIKLTIEQDWKQILMDKRINEINCKIGILDKLKDLQQSKDNAVKDVADALKHDNKFMSKKLIKLLVRLQKLQCIIQRVVEDFEDRMKTGRSFDTQKEIKYIDYLSSLHFVRGKTRNSLLNDLKKERDAALQKEIDLLENLRHLLERNDCDKINQEAEILWEIKHIERLQKDAIKEMNERIDNGLKIRKELKILFDLSKQLDDCENKQEQLLKDNYKKEYEIHTVDVEDKSESDEKDQTKPNRYEKFNLKKYFEERRHKLAMAKKEKLKPKTKK